MLTEAIIFLFAAVIAVPVFKRLGLGSVLGYLVAGLIIGPSAIGLISDVEDVLHFSELGVVMLLFLIGLELQPSRLWALRKEVFGIGGAQVLLTGSALSYIAHQLGLPWQAALVAGFALAMSSTAMVLQMLGERHELSTRHGRVGFSILLFQDLAVIPLLAIVPILASETAGQSGIQWLGLIKGVAAITLVIVIGRYFLRPVMQAIAVSKISEAFTAMALLVVFGTATAMEAVGLSMSLGAFLAGVVLADSEYRHELQANIEPFKGLLLGLFFMAVGMSADVSSLLSAPLFIFCAVIGLIGIKAIVLALLALILRMPVRNALGLTFALAQGGEFAFVLFSIAGANGVLSAELISQLVIVVTLSMMATPLIYPWMMRFRAVDQAPYDEINTSEADVIIAGFGPFGQVVARLLRVHSISFTILDKDAEQVDFVRQFGNAIFYSDATKPAVLKAAHVDKAKIFVVATAVPEESIQIVKTLKQHYPKLRIFACARTRQHAMELNDLGVECVIRRSFHSSLEMTKSLLLASGIEEQEVVDSINMFRLHDEQTLKKQQAFMKDEERLRQSAYESARELEALFESDEADKIAVTKKRAKQQANETGKNADASEKVTPVSDSAVETSS